MRGADYYELDILNTYTISYASAFIQGMDGADDAILFVDVSDTVHRLVVADPQDMSYVTEFDLTWDTPEPFGVAFDGIVPYVNDYGDSNIYFGFDFSGSFADPFGTHSRGMDYDGTYIWEVSGGGVTNPEVGRFFTDGTGFQSWALPGITSQISGMTLYPLASSTGIALTLYDLGATDHYIWLYEFTGSECILLGTAEMPTCAMATGLAYSSYTGTWFAAYHEGAWTVIEFQVNETSLQQYTWGGIKSAF